MIIMTIIIIIIIMGTCGIPSTSTPFSASLFASPAKGQYPDTCRVLLL
jgi:hypothetical protein